MLRLEGLFLLCVLWLEVSDAVWGGVLLLIFQCLRGTKSYMMCSIWRETLLFIGQLQNPRKPCLFSLCWRPIHLIWSQLCCFVFFNQNLYSCLFPLYSKIIERCFEVCDTWSTTLLSGGHRFFLELCPRMSSKSWRRRSRPKLIMETGLFI